MSDSTLFATFYSFKGGVGRSLTLVNTAVELTRRGHSVIIWDMDIEAPGIQDIPYFEKMAGAKVFTAWGKGPERKPRRRSAGIGTKL
ncbi:MAG: P-loop NTPase [Candidatus Aminicenantes bacterium]|nr:P-loop NTPase [Candidatus Aminicenantes bacterium]